jgi:tetratricopeptide (TPR) repeat protein
MTIYAQDDDQLSLSKMDRGLTTSAAMRRFRRQLEKNFAEELEASGCQKVIISDESLSSHVLAKSEFTRLKNFLEKFFTDIIIIVYLREQVSMWLSTLSTQVMAGALVDIDGVISGSTTIGLEDRYDYFSLLMRWRRSFEGKQIKVRIFDEKYLYRNNLLTDFAEAVDVSELDAKKNIRINTSFGMKRLKLMSLLNRHFQKFMDGKINPYRTAVRTAVEFLEIKDRKLQSSKAKEIRAIFYESNKRVSEKFFGDTGAYLKYIEGVTEKEPNASPADEDLSADELVSMLSQIIQDVMASDFVQLSKIRRSCGVSSTAHEIEQAKSYACFGRGSAELYVYLAGMAAQEGHIAESRVYLEKEPVLALGSPDIYFQLSLICLAEHDAVAALRYIEKSIEIDSQNPDYYNQLSKILLSVSELDKAEEAAKQAIALNPENENFKATLQHVLSKKIRK